MKKINVILCVCYLTSGSASDQPTEARILKYDFHNTGIGPYQFGFESSDGISRREKGEVRNEGSEHQYVKVTGFFSYLGPDGHLYEVRYTADDQGFHPEGDHIRVPPFVPWIHHHDDHNVDHREQHETFDGQSTFNPGIHLPNFSPSERISDVSTNSHFPSTEYLPESSSTESNEAISPKPNYTNDDYLQSPDSRPQPEVIYYSNAEKQNPTDSTSIPSNHRHYIPSIDLNRKKTLIKDNS